MYTVRIQDFFGEDIELEVNGYYQPAEDMTRDYPGCAEEFEIEIAYVKETGAEVCLLDVSDESLQEQVLDEMLEERAYAEYGYLMEQ